MLNIVDFYSYFAKILQNQLKMVVMHLLYTVNPLERVNADQQKLLERMCNYGNYRW